MCKSPIRKLLFLHWILLGYFNLINMIPYLQGQTRFMRVLKVEQSENKYINEHTSLEVDKNKRNAWIKKMADSLKIVYLLKDNDLIEPSIIDLPDLKKISYRINGGFGALKCRDETVILVGVHSSHADHGIGDISVALVDQNIIFINKGHVCGNIIHFMSTNLSVPLDRQTYLYL